VPGAFAARGKGAVNFQKKNGAKISAFAAFGVGKSRATISSAVKYFQYFTRHSRPLKLCQQVKREEQGLWRPQDRPRLGVFSH
jgi:hypothetical protein